MTPFAKRPNPTGTPKSTQEPPFPPPMGGASPLDTQRLPANPPGRPRASPPDARPGDGSEPFGRSREKSRREVAGDEIVT